MSSAIPYRALSATGPGGWWIVVFATVLSAVAPLPLLGAWAPAAGPVAAVFPPWWTQARALAAAGEVGDVVRFGALPFIVVVVPAAGTTRPGAGLRHAGAWLLLDPLALGGCAAIPPNRTPNA
jgi:hypothetical protein